MATVVLRSGRKGILKRDGGKETWKHNSVAMTSRHELEPPELEGHTVSPEPAGYGVRSAA